jgi:hypothetical protein
LSRSATIFSTCSFITAAISSGLLVACMAPTQA